MVVSVQEHLHPNPSPSGEQLSSISMLVMLMGLVSSPLDGASASKQLKQQRSIFFKTRIQAVLPVKAWKPSIALLVSGIKLTSESWTRRAGTSNNEPWPPLETG